MRFAPFYTCTIDAARGASSIASRRVVKRVSFARSKSGSKFFRPACTPPVFYTVTIIFKPFKLSLAIFLYLSNNQPTSSFQFQQTIENFRQLFCSDQGRFIKLPRKQSFSGTNVDVFEAAFSAQCRLKTNRLLMDDV